MRKILVLFVISVFFVLGCSNNSSKNINPAEIIPQMSIAKYEEVKAQYKGKVVLVNFFASWCPPCKAEIPDFIKVYNKHKDKFVIIGISIDDDVQKGAEFVVDKGIPYPTFHAERALEAKMNISSIPTNIFYKPDGTLFNFYVGALTEDFLESVIERLSK
ncbi:TlpA family protein disulfide reductase [Deferribacteraceae bacterium V6Fe1]|nr:TlpA family protein disulfide reductase [Deferribacteraceae bacterium V6Fe1]